MDDNSAHHSLDDTLTSECLTRLRAGDPSAVNDLLVASSRRIEELTRKIKRSFPVVGRWEQTEDVAQNATIRLHRALQGTDVNSAEHYFRLIALQIRRELLDLARRYTGPQGLAANHQTRQIETSQENGGLEAQIAESTRSGDPQELMQWIEFHEAIDRLADEERQLFDLLWYHNLSQQAVADMLGQSVRTVKRRWRDAKLSLHELLNEDSRSQKHGDES